MIVDSISRSEGKLLRRLAGVAYERELARELDRLSAAFDKWKEKQLAAHEVSAAIHEFHNGVARDLYVLYNRIHPAQTVPRAVAAGLLAEHEVPADLLLNLRKRSTSIDPNSPRSNGSLRRYPEHLSTCGWQAR